MRAIDCAVLASLLAACSSSKDSSAGTGNATPEGLAGAWCIVKTEVTGTVDHPPGSKFPAELVFTVSGTTGTMSTPGVAGTANGTFENGVWTFQYQATLGGLVSQNQVQVISISPFKGTEEHRYYDQFNQPYGIESLSLEGWRKTSASCW
jgi:hypothetical protein